jgi:hypothetical protein
MRDWREKQEAGGDEMPLVSLQRMAPAEFLTQAFAFDRSAGRQS